MDPHHVDADPDPDFDMMRIRIHTVYTVQVCIS
jgi:hypothetical protein